MSRPPAKGQHHEHQCAVVSAGRRQEASIMSITALSFPQTTGKKARIMSISALSFPRQKASIMSISALSFPQVPPKGQHHEHQCAVIFRRTPPKRQHHEHQCAVSSAGRRQEACIISITALSFPQTTGKRPASSISALSFLQDAAKRPAS